MAKGGICQPESSGREEGKYIKKQEVGVFQVDVACHQEEIQTSVQFLFLPSP